MRTLGGRAFSTLPCTLHPKGLCPAVFAYIPPRASTNIILQSQTALILAVFGTQAGLALVLGGLLLGFHRVYRKSYLLWWACSWFGFAAYLIAATSSQLGYFSLPLASAWRILVSLAGGVGGYLQIAWLGQGTWELVSDQEIPRSRSRLLVTAAIGLGVVAGLLYAWDSSGASARYFIRVGIRSVVALVAFVACGISIWRMQRRIPGWAKTVLAIAVVLYGLEQLNYFYQVLAVFLGRPMSRELGYYGFLDIVLQFGIGLSMAGLLLDEERLKAVAIAEGKRQAEDQLRAREARYRALIEGALDIIIVADARERFSTPARRPAGCWVSTPATWWAGMVSTSCTRTT